MAPQVIPPPPADAEGLRLLQALSSSDPSATWDFARAYTDHLAAWLRARNSTGVADLCEDAAAETVASVLRNPAQFDPGMGMSLLNYLHLSAQRDLLNLLRGEARHAHEPLDENCVELGSATGNYQGKDDDPLQVLCDREDEQERRAFFKQLRGSLTEADQRVLDLMLSGERANAAFADALGVTLLPVEEQEVEVKRAKDRIKARGKRMREGL
jgi:DNA-directed RNA polymerase specialized sigma24 family protein